ncbi:MAG: hypothetical protein IJ874_10295 [Ruminococcus sp.]|nr:hypothetical protein [Ruminococcus sp.]
MKARYPAAFAAILCTAAMLSSCGAKSYGITIRNISEVGISEVYIKPENQSVSMENVLEETLQNNTEVFVELGKYSDEDTSDGFLLQVYSAEDGTDQTFSQLHIPDGSKVTFYLDDWGLAAAVDMTDEEIAELKDFDYQEYISSLETESSTAPA